MMGKNNKNNLIQRLLKTIYYIITIIVCIIVFLLLYYIITSQFHAKDEDYKPGFSIYTIVSPSMTPVINVYDVVVNVKVTSPADIQVGDIITYKSAAANSEGMTITHRVIEVAQLPDGTYEYMTQGDNNSKPDSLYVTFDNVIGKEIVIIPALGRLQFLIANQKGWLVLLLIPVLIYLIKEMVKLIDLFHLRKKVDKIIGTTEDNFIEQRKIKNERRKELIKKELLAKEHKKLALQKSSSEPVGFLEKYHETIVSVNKNKLEQKNFTQMNPHTSNPKLMVNHLNKEEEIILPKIKEKNVEVLDTDELTTKIKEYDKKIEKLDKLIKDIEVNDSKKQENFIEYDNYLQGRRIKVVKSEPALSYKPSNKIKLGFNDIPRYNPYDKATRPISEDISIVRNAIRKMPKKLNLNPNHIKKINRPNKTPNKKKLNFKPNYIKKVIRPNRLPNKKKKPLIVIEKRNKNT